MKDLNKKPAPIISLLMKRLVCSKIKSPTRSKVQRPHNRNIDEDE